MDIRSIILGLLNVRPMTGYELKQVFDTSLSNFSGASFGSIYPTLRKLRQGGLASVEEETREGRLRKVYSITPSGREAFGEALGGELRVPPFRNELLTRLFFFDALPPGRQEEMTGQYLRYLEEKLASLKLMEPLVEAQADPYQKMCYRFGLRLTRDFINNTRRLMDELGEHHGRKR
jgi:DNA-binding PadR family transcriptional regulator